MKQCKCGKTTNFSQWDYYRCCDYYYDSTSIGNLVFGIIENKKYTICSYRNMYLIEFLSKTMFNININHRGCKCKNTFGLYIFFKNFEENRKCCNVFYSKVWDEDILYKEILNKISFQKVIEVECDKCIIKQICFWLQQKHKIYLNKISDNKWSIDFVNFNAIVE